VNIALNEVFYTKGMDYALVINHDVILRPDCYEELLGCRHGFITGVSTDDKSKLSGELSEWMRPRPHPDFSCFLIWKDVYEKVGSV
jgi:hypothetical protein